MTAGWDMAAETSESSHLELQTRAAEHSGKGMYSCSNKLTRAGRIIGGVLLGKELIQKQVTVEVLQLKGCRPCLLDVLHDLKGTPISNPLPLSNHDCTCNHAQEPLLQVLRQKCGYRHESFKTSKPVPRIILTLARTHLLIVPKQPPTGVQVFMCPTLCGTSHLNHHG